MKAVNSPNFGTLPDFGNFPKADGKYAIDIYDAIERMMPYAKGVSAKSYDFDEKGNETTLDFARIMKIVTKAGYHGFVGIEYEGGRLERTGASRPPRSCSSRYGEAEQDKKGIVASAPRTRLIASALDVIVRQHDEPVV
jgi:sugar phosphate isomerase/epimerase